MPATRTSIDASRKVVMKNDRGVNHVLVDGDGLNNVSVQVQEFNVGAAFGSYHYHEGSDNIYPAGSPHKTRNGGDVVARALKI